MIAIKRTVKEFFTFDETTLKNYYIDTFGDDEESMKDIPTTTKEWGKMLLDTSDKEDFYDYICSCRFLENEDYEIVEGSELQWLKKTLEN